MGYQASKKCLEAAKIDVNEVDLILYSTATPNDILPPSYIGIQEKLQIKSCAGFDSHSGCAGFGSALVVAADLIEAGKYKTALVIGADNVSARFRPLVEDKTKMTARALINMMMFGDGAGAMLLRASQVEENHIYYKKMISDRVYEPCGSAIHVGGSEYPYGSEEIPMADWAVTQIGKVSERILPEIVIESIGTFLKNTKKKANDISAYILPVLNEKIASQVLKTFPEFPRQNTFSIEPIGGAMINAAVPLSLEQAVHNQKIKAGDSLVLLAGENTWWQNALLAGYWSPDF